MTAKIDIQRNSAITLNKDGYRATRVALVTGVSGTAAQVLYNAINDAQLPDIGDAHPDVATINLQDITCAPEGGGAFKVTMNYYQDTGAVQSSSDSQARANTAVSTEEQFRDINGVPMSAEYLANALPTTHRFVAEVEVPRVTYTFEYTAATFPTDKIIKYLNKVNSTGWNNHAVGTILCSGIDAEEIGTQYRIKFSFSYKREGWQFVAKLAVQDPEPLFVDPDNAINYEDATKTFTLYKSIDFTPLGFPLDNQAPELVANSGAIKITGSDATLTVA